jgi:hypothetical protein
MVSPWQSMPFPNSKMVYPQDLILARLASIGLDSATAGLGKSAEIIKTKLTRTLAVSRNLFMVGFIMKRICHGPFIAFLGKSLFHEGI